MWQFKYGTRNIFMSKRTDTTNIATFKLSNNVIRFWVNFRMNGKRIKETIKSIAWLCKLNLVNNLSEEFKDDVFYNEVYIYIKMQ